MKIFKNLFKKKLSEEEASLLEEQWYDQKSQLMENILGSEYEYVMHSIIPYEVGGSLHFYYYAQPDGTAIATKELSYASGAPNSNNSFGRFEFVIFTKDVLPNSVGDQVFQSSYGEHFDHTQKILNAIARYSETTTINPYETCEFPEDFEDNDIGGRCLIFSAYGSGSDDKYQPFGLMLVMEVFRSEMDYAREHGGIHLINKLKDAGYYPYSDLSRNEVI